MRRLWALLDQALMALGRVGGYPLEPFLGGQAQPEPREGPIESEGPIERVISPEDGSPSRLAEFLPGEVAVAQADRLLRGQAAADCPDDADRPCCALVNALAHADQNDLARLVSVQPSPNDRWSTTVVELATEIQLRVTNETDLTRLQREVLIPLELQLLDQPSRQCGPDTADRIGSTVSHRLRAYPHPPGWPAGQARRR